MVIIVAILIIGLLCCMCLRKRFNDKSKHDYTSTPTMSDGTWFNLVPNQAELKNFRQGSRTDCVYLQKDKIERKRSTSTIANSYYVPSNCATSKFHEYSEIGSIMADSGRGESLSDEKHYAQVQY